MGLCSDMRRQTKALSPVPDSVRPAGRKRGYGRCVPPVNAELVPACAQGRVIVGCGHAQRAVTNHSGPFSSEETARRVG